MVFISNKKPKLRDNAAFGGKKPFGGVCILFFFELGKAQFKKTKYTHMGFYIGLTGARINGMNLAICPISCVTSLRIVKKQKNCHRKYNESNKSLF